MGEIALELRGRIASAVAAVQALGDATIVWDDEQRRELLAVARGSLQDVTLLVQELAVVGSRAGPVGQAPAAGTPLRDLLRSATAELGQGRRPRTWLPASLPPVAGDPELVVLVLASVLRHALRSAGTPHPDVRATCRSGRVLVRVSAHPPADRRWADRPGRPAAPTVRDRDTAFGPDLSVARGLLPLLDAVLHADAAGGDAAVVLDLPAVPVTARSGSPDPVR